jgi:hypothetical protein
MTNWCLLVDFGGFDLNRIQYLAYFFQHREQIKLETKLALHCCRFRNVSLTGLIKAQRSPPRVPVRGGMGDDKAEIVSAHISHLGSNRKMQISFRSVGFVFELHNTVTLEMMTFVA